MSVTVIGVLTSLFTMIVGLVAVSNAVKANKSKHEEGAERHSTIRRIHA